jgi:hypothetical protein
MKKIETFEGACKALKVNPSALPDVSAVPKKYRKRMIADYKLMIITEAINAGWQPDWNDINEYKYYPWFRIGADKNRPSGFGFSYPGYDSANSYTTVGSRHCFKTREMALYAAEHFEELYQDWHLS